MRRLVFGNRAPVPKEPAGRKGRGRGLAASWESRSAGFPPGSSRLKRPSWAVLSALSWYPHSPACFLFVKDKLWYQNLPKIPFLISSPLQGPGGVLSRATCRAGERLRPALPAPVCLLLLPPPTFHYLAQGPETSSVILEVQPHLHVTSPSSLSPW